MSRAIQGAKNGLKSHYPNPMVGCVIVYDDQIIAQGITSPYTGPHAEVNAINQVQDKTVLTKATLYVTLEPCAHYGNTPPCADLINSYKIPEVVIGILDPNPKVSGKGIDLLQKAGVKVITGVLKEQCSALHKRFLTNQIHKRPYIILKWAQTTKGFIAPPIHNRTPYWISSPLAKQRSHQWRSEEHAILVGANTVLHDNPKLDTRLWKGSPPIPIYLDRDLSIPTDKNLFKIHDKIICITDLKFVPEKNNQNNIMYCGINFSSDRASQIANLLFDCKISSVIVEGGTRTLNYFLSAQLWDEVRVFESESPISKGIKAPLLSQKPDHEETLEQSVLKTYTNKQ